jgi:hypothetical protein
MTLPENKDRFVRRAGAVLSDALLADPLVQHTIDAAASVFERIEHDVYDVIRSRYLDLADPGVPAPDDLVRLGGLVGLDARTHLPTEVFRERLRLFVRAYLQGAGTPQSLLTMAAAELDVIPNGTLQREGSVWIQPVRRIGRPPDVVRLEENPVFRVEKQPVLARTGTRWSVDNPGITVEEIVRPEVVIEALADAVHGPSILLEDLGIGWLSPTVSLARGDRLILRTRPDGAFVAAKLSGAAIEDVTDRIELVGRIPDQSALENGIRLRGGDEQHQAAALVRASRGVRVIRFCARTPGAWGNGLMVAESASAATGRRLDISFDPGFAATTRPASQDRTTWSIAAGPDVLTTALATLVRERFLVQAEDASLHLPLGRSRWMYLDHVESRGAAGDVRHLARLILDYTQFGRTAHHDTDTRELFRFDNVRASFGSASYTIEEERVKITFSWREARPTAVRLEVPAWIDEAEHGESAEERFERLANGIRRIKPAGVSTSVVRSLPAESLRIAEVFPAGMDLTARSTFGVLDRPEGERALRDSSAVTESLAALSALSDQVIGGSAIATGISLAVDAVPVEAVAPGDQATVELAMTGTLVGMDTPALAGETTSAMDVGAALASTAGLHAPVAAVERAVAGPAFDERLATQASATADAAIDEKLAARPGMAVDAAAKVRLATRASTMADAAAEARLATRASTMADAAVDEKLAAHSSMAADAAVAHVLAARDNTAVVTSPAELATMDAGTSSSATLPERARVDATAVRSDAAMTEPAGVREETEAGDTGAGPREPGQT